MRKQFLYLALFITVFLTALTFSFPRLWWILVLFFPLLGLGFYDYFQTKHTIRKNFPLFGRLRYLLETLRPGVRQYFIESDTSGKPFNRLERSLVYQRAKEQTDTIPFGTQYNVYEVGYEWINHSIKAIDAHTLDLNPRIMIGGPQCTKPYSSSIFNISAMSFGSLSSNAILALNNGARIGGFSHNTGEGGLSHYHTDPGGDVVWNVGTGYFSCRNSDGTFNPEAFQKRAVLPNVKMIEIKLSQGAKPGHGGILPAQKVTPEIAKIRLVEMGKDIISPPHHSAFTTPIEFLAFVQKLRTLSEGKPIGFKICIGNKSEFLAICKAMVKTGIYVDFISIDGGEGGTGAAPPEFTNYVGMPLNDAISFVNNALRGFNLRDHIKIISSGRIISGFDIIKSIALGADACNSARGMMFAIGCIQALECNTNTCPTGVATQNKDLSKGLVVADKQHRVANFHKNTVKSAMELLAAAGVSHPNEIKRNIINRRISQNSSANFDQIFPLIEKGVLLGENIPVDFKYDMDIATENHF